MTDDNYNSYEEPKVCNHYNYKLEGDHWSLREDSFRDKNLITTPGWIVKDMLDLLPDSVWNTETTFLIPCIKSGNFAIEVKNRLMKCKDAMERFPSDEERRDHIDSKQLFCIYWYTEEEFDKNLISGHIWGVNGFLEALYSQSINLMCTDDLNFDTFKDKTGKKQEKLLESIKEKFGTVKFDVVIGNPPYNNDLYIDFVEWGHQRANKYSLWITPAKWQAKGGEKNESFRKDIVPYMKDIVYYPCTQEIFDKVAEAGGISYYLLDKQNHDDKHIKISCSMQPLFNSNGFEHNRADMMLNKICTSIVDKCNSTRSRFGKTLAFHQSYYIQNTDSGNKNKTHKDDVEVFGGKAGGEVDDTGNKFFFLGYKPYDELKRTINIDKYKVCISCMTGGTSFFGLFNMDGTAIGLTPASVIGPNQVNKGSYYCLRTFDTLDEAKSLQSYLNCRLIRFLVRCSVVGTTLTEEFFRFVPDPGTFDHIFTDKELYDKYNLTQEEINIIESVIKERK